MKQTIVLIASLLTSISAFSAKYEGKDLTGRLMVTDQATDQAVGRVYGVITIRPSTPADNVLGSVVVEAGGLYIQGHSALEQCSADFNQEEQTLTALCGKDSSVLTLKIKNTNEDLISYLKGDFASSTLTYKVRGLGYTQVFNVNVKKLDLK